MFKTEIFNHGCTSHFPSLDLKITTLNIFLELREKKIDKERNAKLNKQRGSDFESFKFSCYNVSAEYDSLDVDVVVRLYPWFKFYFPLF